MNDSGIQPHYTQRASDDCKAMGDSNASGQLPFQPLVEAWDMLTAAAVLRLRWTAARFSADGLVPLALRESLEPHTCSWLAHR